MASRLKIGLIMGSTREGRMCDRVTKFIKTAVEKQHEVVLLDPDSMDLPKTQQSLNFLMDPTASKVPQNIKDLNELVKTIDGLIIISPEYNWSIPPGLTNLMDNIPPPTWCWKPAAFVHYSISPIGGWRVGMQLRLYAGALGLTVVPKQMGIPVVQNALTTDGKPNNDGLDTELGTLLEHLYWNINAFKNHTKANPPPSWNNVFSNIKSQGDTKKGIVQACVAQQTPDKMFRLKIGLIMGSTRDGRLCDRVTKFVKNAVEKQHEVVVLDPESMDLPKTQQSVNFLMDPSASRVPQNIKDLNELIKTIDGFILITPEYNWCLPPGLTDLMDNIPPTTWCWKPTTFVHYAMSPVGGWRVGMQLRIFAGALGLIVVPKQMGIPMAQNVLTVDGAPNNERLDKELKTLLEHLYWNINAFKNHAKGSQPPNWSM